MNRVDCQELAEMGMPFFNALLFGHITSEDVANVVLGYTGKDTCVMWTKTHLMQVSRGQESLITDGKYLKRMLNTMFECLLKPKARLELLGKLHPSLRARLWGKKNILRPMLQLSVRQLKCFEEAETYDVFQTRCNEAKQHRLKNKGGEKDKLAKKLRGKLVWSETFQVSFCSDDPIWDVIRQYEHAMSDGGVEHFAELQLRHQVLRRMGILRE